MSQAKVVSLVEVAAKRADKSNDAIHDAVAEFVSDVDDGDYEQVVLVAVKANGTVIMRNAGSLNIASAVYGLRAAEHYLFTPHPEADDV